MNKVSRIARSLALLLVLLPGTVGRAQLPVGSGWSGPKFMDSVVFEEGGAWLHIPKDHKRGVSLFTPENGRRIVPPPDQTVLNWMCLRNHALWTAGGDSVLYRWDLSAQPGAWKPVGEVRRGPVFSQAHVLIPLEGPGRYLGLNWVMGFADRDHASYAAVFRETDGRIEFESFVDMPYRDWKNICRSKALPPLPATAALPGQAPAEKPPERFVAEAVSTALYPTYWAPIQVGDHVILGATKTGVLWVFSLKDGSCERVLDLGEMGEKLDKVVLMDHFLLAMQPTKDQRLLVATCDPDVLRFAEAFYLPDASSREAKAKAKKDYLNAIADYRIPVWRSIDPADSWKITKVDPPVGIPDHAWDNHNLQDFQFILGPAGEITTNLEGGAWDYALDAKGLGAMKETKKEPEAKPETKPEPKPATESSKPAVTPVPGGDGKAVGKPEVLVPKR